MSHTPEPWVLSQKNRIGVRDNSDTQSHGMLNVIAEVDKFDFECWEENAKRIVECVNFCERVDSHALKNIRASELLSICGELLIRLTAIDSISKLGMIILPSEQTDQLIEKAAKLLKK